VAQTGTGTNSSCVGRAVRALIAVGTLAALARVAFDLISLAFRLGPRLGIRSAVGLVLPILAGGYAFSSGRHSLRRIQALPLAVRFGASLAAGALTEASIRYFLVLLPIPAGELLIASCIAVLTLGFASDAARSMVLFVGVAAGMLLYIAVLGAPRFVPG